jgi:hypothetical protein
MAKNFFLLIFELCGILQEQNHSIIWGVLALYYNSHLSPKLCFSFNIIYLQDGILPSYQPDIIYTHYRAE